MGLIISVYRSPLGDSTNGGVSSRTSRLVLVNAPGPFEPSADYPPVLIEEHHRGCLRIVPAIRMDDGAWRKMPGQFMMGGNYGATSDSRFSEKCADLLGHYFYGAVAIHDRQE